MAKLSANMNFRWPRKGDRLLRSSDAWDKAISFSDATTRHADIWSGYMRAGEALIDVCNREPSERHKLIYPILFSYRHGLEMAMKWIVSRYGKYAGVSPPEPVHNLWQLWQSCKLIFDCFGGGDPEVGTVGKIVKEFHDLDRSGLSFRYSVNKKGVLIRFPDGLIDLANVRDVMTGVDHFFNGADAVLDDASYY